MIVHKRLVELALRKGCRLEEILDDHKDSFTIPGIAHSSKVS
jgi:hypothetical protein